MPTRDPKAGRSRPDGVEELCARWTRPRDAVFNVLVRTEQHLTAKDIFAALRASSPDIGLTTVYRTLELLTGADLVRRVFTPSGEVRFEYRRGGRSDHHHHLICTACGRIVNYRDFEKEELDLVRRTETVLARKYRFVIQDHNIEFLGLCEQCGSSGASSPSRSARPGETP